MDNLMIYIYIYIFIVIIISGLLANKNWKKYLLSKMDNLSKEQLSLIESDKKTKFFLILVLMLVTVIFHPFVFFAEAVEYIKSKKKVKEVKVVKDTKKGKVK